MPKVVIEFDSDEEKEDINVGIKVSAKKKEVDKLIGDAEKQMKGLINDKTLFKLMKGIVNMVSETLDEIDKMKKSGEKK